MNTHTEKDQKIGNSTSASRQGGRRATTAREEPTTTSSTMIEACDRLSQKLDQVAGLVQEQIEAWKQIREPAAPPRLAPPETAMSQTVEVQRGTRHVVADESSPKRQPDGQGASPQGREQSGSIGVSQDESDSVQVRRDEPGSMEVNCDGISRQTAGAARTEKEGDKDAGAQVQNDRGGQSIEADNALRLAEALARFRNGPLEQVGAVQQALEAIMAFLENQAAMLPPEVDLADILRRLREIEEQQRTLQSQVNASR